LTTREASGTNRELRQRLRSLQLLTHRLDLNDPEHDLLHPALLCRALHEKGNGIKDLVYN
jgi:hypothetical protein